MQKTISKIIFLGILIFLLTSCESNLENNSTDVSQQLVLTCSTTYKDTGISKLSLKNNSFKVILKGDYINELDISRDNEKLLCSRPIREESNVTIFEFNLSDNKIVPIMDYDKNEPNMECVKYVPNTKEISYINENKLYLFDTEKKQKTMFFDEINSYNWSKDGRKLLYAWGDVVEYDLKTKQKKIYGRGYSPVYSKDNNVIAYVSTDSEIVVVDLLTNKKWVCTTNLVDPTTRLEFSPDGKYIAYGLQKTDIVHNPQYEIYALDFVNNNKSLLIKGNHAVPAFIWK